MWTSVSPWYAAATYNRDVSLSIAPELPPAAAAIVAKAPGVFTVDSDNFDLLQQADVTPATELSAAVTGAGTALVQLAAGACTRPPFGST